MILSDGIWRRLFGGDPAILGRKLRLDTDLYTVVGVMKPGFRHPGLSSPRPVEMWITTGFSGRGPAEAHGWRISIREKAPDR